MSDAGSSNQVRYMNANLLLGLLLSALILAGCSIGENSNSSDTGIETNSPDIVSVKSPNRISSVRNINQDQLSAVLVVNGGTPVVMESEGGLWSAAIQVPTDEYTTVKITWRERYEGVDLELAEQTRQLYVGESPVTTSFADSDYYDGADRFDEDSDGISNLDERIAGSDPLENTSITSGEVAGDPLSDFGDGEGDVAQVGEGAICDDASRNDGWVDNCKIYEGSAGFSTSLYALGIQRIVFCIGINPSGAATIGQFADGIYGPNTALAVEEFQSRRGILADGVVGPQTWGELEDVLDQPVVFDSEFAAYSVNSVNCGSEVQFFQRRAAPYDWRLAETPGSSSMIPFSTESP